MSAVPPTLDLALLLAPIDGENPCGRDLRYAPVRGEIKALRRALLDCDPVENPRPWSSIVGIASQALAQESKDLMLAAYLTEALTEEHGFAGLRDGLRLLNGLIERYWESLHPSIDEDGDLARRLSPLDWLASPGRGSRLVGRLAEMDPFRGEPEAAEQSRAVDAQAWEQGLAKLSPDPLIKLFGTLRECREEAELLDRALRDRCGALAPDMQPLKDIIQPVADIVEERARTLERHLAGFIVG